MNKRQIKFRAWGGDLDKQMYRFDVFNAGDFYQRHNWNTDKNPLMQFTGLLDKNGKEIYEGDVVKINYAKEELPKYRPERNDEEIIPVKWVIAGFNIAPKYFLNNEVYEVIGNIYENPELINSPIGQK